MADRAVGIGEASARTGLTERQIRYYERLGLLSPRRTPGRQRLYGTEELARLAEIRRLLDQGQTLAEVRESLSTVRTGALESDVHSRLLSRQALRSLYPVSNRAELERLISEREHAEEDGVE